jgi:Protein of unknown function (DUF3034)
MAPAEGFLGADSGKLLLTGAFNDIDGAAGGGLVPMALITSYGSQNSWGANAHVTDVRLHDFHLLSYGLAASAFDRIELSYAKQQLDVVGTALDGISIRQDVFGMKVKLLGDIIYEQASWLPQLSIGTQYLRNEGIDDAAHVGLPGLVSATQLGARSDHGWDFYAAATKVFLGQNLLVNVVGRASKANQYGLLGFGGDLRNHYSFKPEASVAYLLSQRLAVGADFRANAHNLSVDNQRSGFDIFTAWAPTKNISVVGAYVNLGSILAPVTHVTRSQDGPYLSLQVGF